jgi:hypothetical protein
MLFAAQPPHPQKKQRPPEDCCFCSFAPFQLPHPAHAVIRERKSGSRSGSRSACRETSRPANESQAALGQARAAQPYQPPRQQQANPAQKYFSSATSLLEQHCRKRPGGSGGKCARGALFRSVGGIRRPAPVALAASVVGPSCRIDWPDLIFPSPFARRPSAHVPVIAVALVPSDCVVSGRVRACASHMHLCLHAAQIIASRPVVPRPAFAHAACPHAAGAGTASPWVATPDPGRPAWPLLSFPRAAR